MEQNIVVAGTFLKDSHKENICRIAGEHGWNVLFFDRNQDALPAMEQAQIAELFAQNLAGEVTIIN